MEAARQMMIALYLVRHAHADWAADEERPLSERGHHDSRRVADVLQAYPIGAIYSSPFRRARETVAPLAARLALAIRMEPALRERRLGQSSAGFRQAVEATWRDPSFSHPGGESNAVAQRRGLAFIRRLQEGQAAEHVVLSTHGNLLALILQGFVPEIDYAFWTSLTMPDIHRLSMEPGGKSTVERLWKEDRACQ